MSIVRRTPDKADPAWNHTMNCKYVKPNCKEIRDGADRCERHGY